MKKFLSLIMGLTLLFSPIKVLANENKITNNEFSWYYSFDKNLNKLMAPKETPYVTDDLAIYKGDETQKVLYLTFDEGYENGFTPKILEVLNNNNVPAAFFVTKPYITGNPDIIKSMVDGGHLVCNHTSRHKSMPTLANKPEFKDEFTNVEIAYKEVTGKDMPKYFRPPMGRYSHKALVETKDLGYISVFWSFAYKDWLVDKQPSREYAINKITSNIHNGQILLLHACSKTNTEILDEVLKKLKNDGYEFKSLDHLMENKKTGEALN